MVERQPRVLDRRRPARRRRTRPSATAPRIARQVLRALPRDLEIRNDDDALDRGQLRDDVGHLVEDRQRLAVVPVAVDGEEHARLDLPEAVEHALHAEIRRARRPHGAQARRPEHRADRLGHVGDVRRDPVARRDAQRLQRRSRPATPSRRAPRARRGGRACPRRETPAHRRASSAARRVSRFSAKLRRASGNQRAPGIRVGSTSGALAALSDHAREVPERRARTPRAPRSTSATARHSRGTGGRPRSPRAARTR